MPKINDRLNIREKFIRALDDGEIGKNEVLGILKQAKDGGAVTRSELSYLRAQVEAVKDTFTPAARAEMQKFLKDGYVPYFQPDAYRQADGRMNLPDPAPTKATPRYVKPQWVDGELEIGETTPDEVLQGQLGDCYLIASLGALVQRDPDFVKKAITDNHDGTYTVRFYQKSLFGLVHEKVDVRVDAELVGGRNGEYGRANDGALWVSILEKAYAAWRGGYDEIGNGGLPGPMMKALTGQRSSFSLSLLTSSNRLEKRLRDAFRDNKAVVAGALSNPASPDIAEKHAYIVTGISTVNGTTVVTVRNPWGRDANHDASANGVTTMTLEVFRKSFPMVFIN